MTSKAMHLAVAVLGIAMSAAAATSPFQAEAAAKVDAAAVVGKPDASKFGFAADYSWVIGTLVRRDLEGGFWQIRFLPGNSPKAKTNPHRGVFVLGNPPQLKGYKGGETVKLTGRISPAQMSAWQAGTIYEVKTVQRLGAETALYGHAKDWSWARGRVIRPKGGRGIGLAYRADTDKALLALTMLRGGNALAALKDGDFVHVTGMQANGIAQIAPGMEGTIYGVQSVKVLQPAGASPAKPAPPAKLTDAQLAKLKKLLAELGSDDFQTRETAEAEIKKLGPAALPHVRPLAKSDDAEVAERAARIVEHLENMLPPEPSKVSAKLSLDKAKYKVGERVTIKIELKNEGTKAVQLPGGGSSYPWMSGTSYTVTGPDGKEIAPFATGLVAVRKMIYMMPIVLQPSATRGLSVYASLVKDAPKLRRPLPVRRKQGAAAGAAPQKAPSAPKGVAYLMFPSGGECFALPKAGKYSLKLRLVGLDPNAAAPKPGEMKPVPGPGGVIRLQNAQGQVQVQAQVQGIAAQQVVIQLGGQGPIVIGPDGTAVAGKTKPLVGTVESNVATFELVE